MRIDLGKIKMVWRGVYDENAQYEKDDVVYYKGSSYICVAARQTPAVEPPLNSTGNEMWELMAAGADNMLAGERGGVVVRGKEGNECLAPGAYGAVLTSRGPNADPVWETPKSGRGMGLIATGLPNMSRRSGGYGTAGVIMGDGSIRVWGSTDYGKLGRGPRTVQYREDDLTPVTPFFSLGSGVGVVKWHLFDHSSICLLSNGSVLMWGRDGDTLLEKESSGGYVSAPKVLPFAEGVKIVDFDTSDRDAGGVSRYHAAFLDDKGNLYTDWSRSTRESGLRGDIEPFAADIKTFTCVGKGLQGRILAIGKMGEVLDWRPEEGDSSFREKGGRKIDFPAPCRALSATGSVVSVFPGGHGLALLEDGQVHGWGYNQFGQLGSEPDQLSHDPHPITALGSDNVGVLTWGNLHGSSLVLKEDGSVMVFGYNYDGRLGRAPVGDTQKTRVEWPPKKVDLPGGKGKIKQVLPLEGGDRNAGIVFLFENGEVWASGYNAKSNLGIGYVARAYELTHVPVMEKVVAICPVGTEQRISFGMLTEGGLYYQTGREGASQAIRSKSAVRYPYRIPLG